MKISSVEVIKIWEIIEYPALRNAELMKSEQRTVHPIKKSNER